MTVPSRAEIDVVVVGAGAAGLGAAMRLRATRPDLGLVVFEAGRRIGGRARTLVPARLGAPVDLGCGWLHGARTNPWTQIAGDLGFAIDRTPAPWNTGGRELGLSPQDRDASAGAMARFFERVEAWSGEKPDCALGELLEPGNRWNGLIDAVGTFINGAELSRASVRDYQRYDPGPGPDWRVLDGYGRLIETFAAGAPVRLGTEVTRIDHSAKDRITVDTVAGTVAARAVVVTISTNVLAAEAIRFAPALPEKIEAAAHLPLGLANKLFLVLEGAEDMPVDGHLLGSPFRTATAAYQIRPSGRPMIEAYFGGELAERLEREGEAAAFAFVQEELVSHFGSDFEHRVSPLAMSAWRGDPLFKGAYSYARPGGADCRAALAAPVDDRLFFAGEACAPCSFSTAHGAYQSGVAAADALSAALRPGGLGSGPGAKEEPGSGREMLEP